jgi:diguanylate cyclase (GGDEF)-like protein
LLLKYIIQVLVLLFVVIVNTDVQAVAEDGSRKSYSIAINQTSYPYHFVNEDGQPDGIMVELWQLWAEKQQVNIKFVPMNWEQTLTKVQNSTVDIHAGLSLLDSRKETLDFTKPFFSHEKHLFVHRSLTDVHSITELSPYSIGVAAGSSHHKVIQQRYPELSLKVYESRHDIYRAALNKEIMVFAGVEKISKNFNDYQKLHNDYPNYKRLVYNKSDYGAAVAKEQTALLDFVSSGISKISAEEKSAIERKWLGIDRSDNVLTLAYSTDLPPFMSISEAGNPQGFLVDLWNLWSQYSGHRIEFIVGEHQDALNYVSNNQADIHIAISQHDSEIENFALGPIVYNLNFGLFFSNQLNHIHHTSEIENQRIGIVEGVDFISDLKAKFPTAKLVKFNSYDELFIAAQNHKIDIIAGVNEMISRKLIQSDLLSSYFHFEPYSFNLDIRAAVGHDKQELNTLIEDGFTQIPIDELVKLEKDWRLNKSPGFFRKQAESVSLNVEERLWLASNNNVRLGVVSQWAPIEFIDDFGELNGINPDIYDLISQRTNINFEFVTFENWNQLYQGLLDGQVDVIGSATPTDERQMQVEFTQSYWSMPWVIVHPRQLGNQLNLKNFNGKTLAITKGYYLVSRIRKEYPMITLKLVNSNEDGLQAVQQGIVDGFIEPLSSATELMKRESLVTLLMSVIEEVDVDRNHLAVNKDLPLLRSILDKALLTISDTEKQNIYEKWFDINIATGLDKSVVMRVAAQIGVLIFIVIIIIMVWNRRLYLEIKNRKRLEKQMKYMATHDDLTGLANRVLLKDRLNNAISFHQRQKLEIAVLFIDLDGFKTINDTYGHDVGDELLIEVSRRLLNCVRDSDTVVRFGGDEFVLLLTGLHKQDEAAYVANKVLKVIQQPIKLSAANAEIGCSIGIAMYPNDGDSDNELLKVADTLMYRVKAAGKNHYVFNN